MYVHDLGFSIALIILFLQIHATSYSLYSALVYTEAEFLDVNGTKVLRVFLLAFHSHLN